MKTTHRPMIVLPPSFMHSDDYLTFNRVCLFHVINPTTKRAFCGRDADMWDMPYRGIQEKNTPTIAQIIEDERHFCKQCARSLRRIVEVVE